MLSRKVLIEKLGEEYKPMIDKISVSDFTKCIAQYSGISIENIKDEIIENYLTLWAKNKKRFFDLFGDIRVDMDIKYTDESRDYENKLEELGKKYVIYYHWLKMFESHSKNKINRNDLSWSQESIMRSTFPNFNYDGTSITHFFKEKLNAPDDLVTAIGRVFENATIDAKYTLSIDPVDIMLSSENPYNWTSCYRLENFADSHADGCLAGVIDKDTVISYIWNNEGEFTLYNLYKFKKIRYKRARITLAINENFTAVHFNTIYPWKRDTGEDFKKLIRDKVETYLAEKTNKENIWRKYNSYEDKQMNSYRIHGEYGYSEYDSENVYMLKGEEKYPEFQIYNEAIKCPCGCGEDYMGSYDSDYMEYNGEGHVNENWCEEGCNEEWCDYADEYVDCDHDCENCRAYLQAHAHCEIDGEEHACSERDLWQAEQDGDADFDDSSVIECNPERCAECPFYRQHHPELQEADNAAEEPADQDPANEEPAAADSHTFIIPQANTQSWTVATDLYNPMFNYMPYTYINEHSVNVEKEEIYQNIINRRNFTFEEFKKLIIREVRNFDNIEYTISNGDNSKYISIIIPRIITNKQEIVEYIKNTIYSEQSN